MVRELSMWCQDYPIPREIWQLIHKTEKFTGSIQARENCKDPTSMDPIWKPWLPELELVVAVLIWISIMATFTGVIIPPTRSRESTSTELIVPLFFLAPEHPCIGPRSAQRQNLLDGKKLQQSKTGQPRRHLTGGYIHRPQLCLRYCTGFPEQSLYFSERDGQKIYRSNLDGSNKTTLFSSLGRPLNLALDVPNNHIYWTDEDTAKIERGNLDGTGRTDVVTGLGTPIGLAIHFPQIVPLTDANFQSAVNLWFDNQAEANATYGHISDWNVSGVTDMNGTFYGRTNFNEDIGNWDVSNVTNMNDMFRNASSFNQNIEDWNTSSVTTMHAMFKKASSFNQPVANWDVSAVKWLGCMFSNASLFNQPIEDWNVSNVESMHSLFHLATSFNQPIADWNTSSVTDMRWMFLEATAFDKPIGNWNTSLVSKMINMFKGATSFDQDLSDWNVSSVIDFNGSFYNTPALSNANKGKIHQSFSSNSNWPYDWREFVALDDSNFQTAVNLWFDNQAEANATYGHISDWNVTGVTDMSFAFRSTMTNQPIGNWDVQCNEHEIHV